MKTVILKIGDTLMVKEKYNQTAVKINTIRPEFSDHHLTNYAGLVWAL